MNPLVRIFSRLEYRIAYYEKSQAFDVLKRWAIIIY